MRLDNSRESSNIEDRRGRRMRMGGRGKIGLGTIVLALVAMYFGIDPGIVLQNDTAPVDEESYDNGPASTATPETRFVSKLLADTEDTWGAIFQTKGWGIYQQANYTDQTACRARGCHDC